MDDMIYCVSERCPYKDCNRSAWQLKNEPDKSKMVSTANLAGICRRYLYWVLHEAEKEEEK